jgi:hypothetical protein
MDISSGSRTTTDNPGLSAMDHLQRFKNRNWRQFETTTDDLVCSSVCSREYAIEIIFYCQQDLCGDYDTPGVAESIMEDERVLPTKMSTTLYFMKLMIIMIN